MDRRRDSRRTHVLGPLLVTLLGSFVFSTTWSFVSPGAATSTATIADAQGVQVQASALRGISLPSVGKASAQVAGGSSFWMLACAAGIAAAVAGLGRFQKQSPRMRAYGKVAVNAGQTALDQLRTMTTVVADTGILEDIKKFRPQDATTNPSLVLKALSGPDAKAYFDKAIAWSKSAGTNFKPGSDELVTDICDRLAVLLGCDILKVVPGVVSTEVDARLSFDAEAMVAKGRYLSQLYQEQGYGKDRVLIKLASTWEAMDACKRLENEGIHTNMTLVLSLPQAIAAAEAGATLISPFVGRILDWHKKAQGRDFTPEEDPGVLSVREIFAYYKKYGYDTIVMGASFRSAPEVLALSGCDKMTISPAILGDLEGLHVNVQRRLSEDGPHNANRLEDGDLDEDRFRWHLNENPMATELLASGIRAFGVDGKKLEDLVRVRLQGSR